MRILKLRFDENYEEIRKNIFLRKYLIIKSGQEDKVLTLKEVLFIWGYESFFDEMIENFERKIKCNPNLSILVFHSTGELNENKKYQRMLEWNIYDENTGEYGLCGGTCFQNDEMTFHT
jgi:hypothetical protein